MRDAIRIFPDKRQKFVLVRISKEEGELLALWSNPDIEWHNDIVQEMTAAGHTVSEVLGGGWLYLDAESQELYVWGKSDRFGASPRPPIKELIEQELPSIALYLDQEPD